MSFGIGRDIAEVQILEKNQWNVLNILKKICINIATDVS